MTLEDFLDETRARIDACLERTLPDESHPPVALHAAMRYAVLGGGKRLRPALAFGAAIACAEPPVRALPVAAAAELVHAYSLVHDDLPAMDDDAERRGRPTVWVKFGEAIAILAGDALLAQAFGALAAGGAPAEVVERLADTAGSLGLVGGQADDLAFDAAAATRDGIESIHARKTAALFRFATWGAGRMIGAAGVALDALDRFGLEYGHAFQLADDLADAGGGGSSVLALLSSEAVGEAARAHLSRAASALDELPGRTEPLRGLADRLAGQLG